ncbi:MAG: hypothetical protein IJR83_02465 [Clostridia bacterium]|nr:hypothetical protein [Clostridia bacterium]
MKKYLYVDTENTGLSFIDLVNRMGKSWKVTIFYSVKSPKLTFAEMDRVAGARCGVRFIECRNGRPNAMDFCIMTHLGMNVERHPKAMHLIMSRDKGYLSGIDLLRSRGYYVGEIVLDEQTHTVSWVSAAEGAKPYDRVREYFDSLFALEQIPKEGLLPAGAAENGEGLLLPGNSAGAFAGTEGNGDEGIPASSVSARPAGSRRRRGGRGRGGRGGGELSGSLNLTAASLEKKLIDILIDHFDAVGVDRQRRLMGQVMKRGLQVSCENGELHFDRFLPSLRKFAVFKADDDAVRELLQHLEGIDSLLISGTEAFYDAEGTAGESLDAADETNEDAEEMTAEEVTAEAVQAALYEMNPDDDWLKEEERSDLEDYLEDDVEDDPEDSLEEDAEE